LLELENIWIGKSKKKINQINSFSTRCLFYDLTSYHYHTPYSLCHHEDHLNEGIPNLQSHVKHMMRTLLGKVWDKQNKHIPVFNLITHVLFLEEHIFDM